MDDDTSVNVHVRGAAGLDEYEAGTRDGVVRVALRGEQYPGTYEAVIDVEGELEIREPFTVLPYTVEILELPARLRTGQSGEFVLRARDGEGRPPPIGTAYQLVAEGLIVEQESTLGDADGEARVRYRAGYAPATVQVRAGIGYSQATVREVEVGNVLAGSSPVSAQQIVLVGDRTADGTVDVERYDGITLQAPYATSLEVDLRGAPSETMTLTLGTPERPNVEPLVAYYLGEDGSDPQTVRDATGLNHARIVSGTGAGGGPTGVRRQTNHDGQPGESLLFDASGHLSSSLPREEVDASSIGFRIDVNVGPSATGTVFSVGGGALELKPLGNGRLQLDVEARSTDGIVGRTSIETASLTGGWHTVAGVLSDGELSLYADGRLQWSEEIDALALPEADDASSGAGLALELGRGFSGAMDNFELYDPAATPLLALSTNDGEGSALDVQLDSEGRGSVTVRSRGQLNAARASALAHRSVLLVDDEGTESFVNLLALDEYADIAGVYATTIYAQDGGDEVPPIDLDALDRASLGAPAFGTSTAVAVRDFLIPPAHAFFGLSRSTFLERLGSLVSVILPVNEVREIWVQLGHLATDPAKFEPAELAINIISLATYFPVMRPLQPAVRPLKALYRKVGRKPFAKAAAGVLGGAFERMFKQRKTDHIEALVPFLLISAELVRHPEALDMMIDGIESPDDMWTWVRFLTLPEGGWEGEGPPPLVAFAEPMFDLETDVALGPDWLGFVIGDARAATKPGKGGRKSGAKVGNSLTRVKELVGRTFDPRDFTNAIKVFAEGLQNRASRDLRRASTSPAVLAISVQLARTAKARFQNFLKGRTSARIPPALFLATGAYLEQQLASGYLHGLGEEKAERLATVIRSKYVGAMADILLPGQLNEENGKIDESTRLAQYIKAPRTVSAMLNGSAHGSLFHLAMLAYYTSTQELVDSERSRWVHFYESQQDKDENFDHAEKSKKRRFLRYVDIVLSGKNGTERWVELKSLQRKDLAKRYQPSSDGFKTWGGPKGSMHGFGATGYHKQFTLDRAALNEHAREIASFKPKRPPVEVSEFTWLFQSFNVERRTSPVVKAAKNVVVGSGSTAGHISERLIDQAYANAGSRSRLGAKRIKFSLGLNGDRQSDAERVDMAERISNFDIATKLVKLIRESEIVDDELRDLLERTLEPS